MSQTLYVKFGGPVGSVRDLSSGLTVAPRVFGEMSLTCADTPADPDALIDGVRRLAVTALPSLFAEPMKLVGLDAMKLATTLAERVNAETAPQGIRVDVRQVTISFSDEDRERLKADASQRAKNKR